MDRVDRGTRSRIMRAVRSRDTGPEVAVRMALVRAGVRHKRNVKGLPGTPDFVIGNLAVFVDGDFWHGRLGIPKSNRAFWEEKFRRNAKRDREADEALFRMGMVPVRIWESETRGADWKRLLDRTGIRRQIGHE